MRPALLHDLPFDRYLGLTATIFAALGVIVGAFGLVASLFGADVFIRLLPLLRAEGVGAGLLGLLAMPVFFALLGVLVGALTFYPFRWLQHLLTLFGPRQGAPASRSGEERST